MSAQEEQQDYTGDGDGEIFDEETVLLLIKTTTVRNRNSDSVKSKRMTNNKPKEINNNKPNKINRDDYAKVRGEPMDDGVEKDEEHTEDTGYYRLEKRKKSWTPNTGLQCLADRQRKAEYHEIIRSYGEPGCLNYDFLKPQITPVVLNVVCAASIDRELDLKKIITLCNNVEYNPKRFAPCVMRIRKPRSTCLMFSSGRMIISGCKSEADSYIAARRFVRILQKRVDPTIEYVKSYEIQNMSASCTLPFGLGLAKMASYVAKDCRQFYSYEPELFPGMVWRLTEPNARIVLFSGGAVLFTGVKSEDQLNKAFELIYPLCRMCRR